MTDKDQTEDGKRAVGGLARKLAASKEGTAGTGGSLTLKALRRSVARAAEDLCELPMAVIAARQTNRVPEDLTGLLSDKHLLVVLDCPEGRIGGPDEIASPVALGHFRRLNQKGQGLVVDAHSHLVARQG